MGGNNIFIIKNIMSKRLLITESERTHIQKMYGINKGILLFESKDELENKIEDSFDENPDLFLDNIITEIPFNEGENIIACDEYDVDNFIES